MLSNAFRYNFWRAAAFTFLWFNRNTHIQHKDSALIRALNENKIQEGEIH